MLGAITAVWGAIGGWWNLLQWLTARSLVPHWAPLALGAFSLIVGAVAFSAVRLSNHVAGELTRARAVVPAALPATAPAAQKEPPRDPLLAYRSDVFDGVRWRWKYDYDRLDMPSDFKAYCPNPKCDLELTPLGGGMVTTFSCPECKRSVQILHRETPNVYTRIRALVTRELRRKGAEA